MGIKPYLVYALSVSAFTVWHQSWVIMKKTTLYGPRSLKYLLFQYLPLQERAVDPWTRAVLSSGTFCSVHGGVLTCIHTVQCGSWVMAWEADGWTSNLTSFCFTFKIKQPHVAKDDEIGQSGSRDLKTGDVVSECCCLRLSVVSDSFAAPWNCSTLGSSVHGTLQAKILEWGCHSLL